MLAIAGAFLANGSARAYDVPSVVINEVLYNPQSGVDGDEFLELYNTTNADISLENWCFTTGITMCFGNITIPAQDYVVVSPDGNQTTTTYGVTVAGTYTGKLDNGGEQVTLSDNNNVAVSTLQYDDVAPWPTSPDGNGTSLELKDPTYDVTLPASWAASVGAPTPKAANSVLNLDLPEVSDVSSVEDIVANQTVAITADVANASSVNLVYRTVFNAEQTIAMLDDGLHGDGAAGDGRYGAAIPGQTAGILVRYKVIAENVSGEASSPSNDESINYFGYMVQDPANEIAAPTLQWFIDDADYANLMLEDRLVAPFNQYSCVIVYGNQVFDNAKIRIKGEYSSSIEFAKRPFKVDLPSGYTINIPEVADYPLPQFHLNSDFPQNTYVTSLVSWDVAAYAGLADHPRGKVLLRRNGEVVGAYTMMAKFDGPWRDRNFSATGLSYDTGVLYEDYWELSSGNDPGNSLRNALRSNLDAVDSPERREYALNNLEVPNIINYMSTMALIRQHDWSNESNTMMYLDTEGNGRWSAQPWDFDLAGQSIWNGVTEATPGMGYMISPYDTPDYITPESRFMFTPVWDDPVLRQMYMRRLRNLIDEVMVSGKYNDYIDQQYAAAAPALNLDYLSWYDYDLESGWIPFVLQYLADNNIPNDPTAVQFVYAQIIGPDWDTVGWDDDFYTEVKPLNPYNRLQQTKWLYTKQIQAWLGKYVDEGLLPEAEPTNPSIKISEINYNPQSGQAGEYLELFNPNDTPIDLTGWRIEGVDLTLPGGAVLPANGYGLVVKDDPSFRSTYGGGQYVLAQYSGALDNNGETIGLIRDDNSVADSVSYSPSSPWPTGGGASIELIASSVDGSNGSCWAPSASIGTPGMVNNPLASWVAGNQDACFPNTVISQDTISAKALSSGSIATSSFIGELTEIATQPGSIAADAPNDQFNAITATTTNVGKAAAKSWILWLFGGILSFGAIVMVARRRS